MIAVVIIVVLAGVGFPLYADYVTKSRRSEAKSALMELAAVQERYFAVNGSYATAAELGAEFTRINAGAPNYDLTIAEATTTFTITATGANKQASDGNCKTFVVNQIGVQTATGATPTKCW